MTSALATFASFTGALVALGAYGIGITAVYFLGGALLIVAASVGWAAGDLRVPASADRVAE